jgi:four helix bundle protein
MTFQYRRLIVYQKAMMYDEHAARLIPLVRKVDRSLADHLQRSGNSLLTNLAEAASEDRPLMKAAGYRTAKREAEECALAWEKSLRRGITPHDETEQAIELLDECARMLAALIRRFDPNDHTARSRRQPASTRDRNNKR